jgi:hypothetical protein
VPNYLLKHWNDYASWEIAKALHYVVLTATKEVILVSSFLYIFANEITIVDNQSWIFVHCYVVVGWKQMPILFTFECLVEGGVATNIKNVILAIFITYGRLTNE